MNRWWALALITSAAIWGGLFLARPTIIEVHREHPHAVVPVTADFDGDGRADVLMGEPHQSGGYAKLWVVMGDGRTIGLPSSPGGVPVFRSVFAANAGGPRPVVIAAKATGGSVGSLVEAFIYHSKTRAFRRLTWDDDPAELVSIGLTPSWNPVTETVMIPYRMHDPVRHIVIKVYRYREGRMEHVNTGYGPATEELPYPQEDWGILLAALNTVGLRLHQETPRYFADRDVAEELYSTWRKRLPEGMTYYLDQRYHVGLVDGSFAIWGNTVSPDGKHLSRAVGLQGVVSFALHGNRKVMSELEVREVPLVVQTPGQAVKIVRGLPEAKGFIESKAIEVPPPFFDHGKWQVNLQLNGSTKVTYLIDARTGQIERIGPN